MESIDVSELCDTVRGLDTESDQAWLKWALIALVTQADDPKLVKQGIDTVFPDREKDGGHCIARMEVKINGHEVKFSELIKRLKKGYDEHVREEAQKLLGEKTSAAWQVFDDAVQRLAQRLDEIEPSVPGFTKERVDG